jgi:hypothetical protein
MVMFLDALLGLLASRMPIKTCLLMADLNLAEYDTRRNNEVVRIALHTSQFFVVGSFICDDLFEG